MLKIVYSFTNGDSAEHLLSLLKCCDKNLRHIVFTPDRANLNYQNQIFDILNEECLFDVDVTTISRFASRFNDDNKVLTKQGGIAIVKKILIENKKQLKIFSKSVDYNGFALSLFESLCMFKSCKITPDKIDTNTNSVVLNNKLSDLKFVYEKYEEYLQGEYTDSFNILNLCASKINKDEYKDTVFYFVGFEDFTKQGLFLIEKMMRCAKDVYVSMAYSKKGLSKNYSIYDTTLLANLIDMCKVNGVSYDIEKADAVGGVEQVALKKNLFGFGLEQVADTQKVGICQYENILQEVEGTVKYMVYLLQKNALRYSDFTIVVSDIDKYKQALIDNFAKYKIPYYLDQTSMFCDNVVCRYILSVIKLADDPSQIFGLLNSSFSGVAQHTRDTFQNHVQKFGLVGNALIDCQLIDCDYVASLRDYLNKTKKCNTVGEYLKAVSDFLEESKFSDIDLFAKNYIERQLVDEYKKLSQALDITSRVFDELREVVGEYECSHKTFADIYCSFVENINLTLPPIVADSVFVGAIETSFVKKTKYTFVLGCNEGNMPNYSSEVGLFSDKEIGLMPQNTRLNPTILQINRRKKLKVFENITNFGDYLLLSFHTSNGKSKMFASAFVEDVQTLFGIKISDMSWIDSPYTIDEINQTSAVFNNATQEVIDENFAKLLREFDFMSGSVGYEKYLSLLHKLASTKVLDSFNFQNNIDNIDKNSFVENGRIGVSEIESFNICPYKHFVEYGLKIKEKKGETFDAIDYGQIIHEFLRNVVPMLEKREYAKPELVELVEKCLMPILARDEYVHLVKNPYNRLNIKALKNECERLLRGLVYQFNSSDFAPFAFEKPFTFGLGKVGSVSKEVVLVGVVDRIDRWGDYYTIVDYKTGNTEMKDFTDIKSGKKWQLIVYMYVESKGKLRPAGCFYLPIKNNFNTKDSSPYQMQGLINNDAEVVVALDNNLSKQNAKSKIVPLEVKEYAIKENTYYKTMCLNDDQIAKLSSCVMERVKERVGKLMDGDIRPYPLAEDKNTPCKYCKYLGLCNFNKVFGNETNKVEECKSIDQLFEEVADE